MATYTLDGVPQVAIYGRGRKDWTEKLTLASQKRVDESDYDLIDGDGELHPREMIDKLTHWQALRADGLMDMDYQDFVNTYGAETREDEASPNLHRPELMYWSRDFQYPVNIVEPTTGVPATAVAWSVQSRVDKDFRFNEPGFLVGLMVCRPKVYLGKQEGSVTGVMNSVLDFLPAVLQQNYEQSYKLIGEAAGPLAGAMTESYWLDIRDIYLGGEQFCNYSPSGAVGAAALPLATGQRRYMASADIDLLFKTPSGGGKATSIYVDGISNFSIAGRQTRVVQGTKI